jgi:hypothetical protein
MERAAAGEAAGGQSGLRAVEPPDQVKRRMEFLRRHPEVHFQPHAPGQVQRAVWVTPDGGRAEATGFDLEALLDKLEARFGEQPS